MLCKHGTIDIIEDLTIDELSTGSAFVVLLFFQKRMLIDGWWGDLF
jgi:hypothetical protein